MKSLLAALTAIFVLIGTNLSAEAAAPVPNFKVVSTSTSTVKLSWTKYAAGKVTKIELNAIYGKTKKTKTVTPSTYSYTFGALVNNRNYTFKITSYKGTKIVGTSTITGKTKKLLQYNSIFFGQPKDMTLGDSDQLLFALPSGGTTVFSTTTPNQCSIVNESYVHAIAIGECVIIASNDGDDTYGPAAPETKTISISAPLASLNPTLLWSDEFNQAEGSGPSAADWNITTGDGCGTAAGCGWGNSESESYAACALKQDGSSMIITATTPTGDANCVSNKTWTSGKFTSLGKRDFTYGYFESRMKMPVGGGSWPAFWLLGSNIDTIRWPACGEIDIMEYAGNVANRSTSAIHYANSSGVHDYKTGATISPTEYSADYHTYGLLWLPNEMTFYIDGKQSYKVSKKDTQLTYWPFGPNAQGQDPKMYLIFNLAMGGNYGGRIESGLRKTQLAIDYVRYYKVGDYGKTN